MHFIMYTHTIISCIDMDINEMRRRYREKKAQEEVSSASPNIEDNTRVTELAAAAHDTRNEEARRQQPVQAEKLPSRNDLCPCGSGKKFKACHGRNL